MNNGVGRYLPRSNDTADRKGVILSALEVALPLATLVAVIVAMFADPIAKLVLRAPETTPVLRAAAIGIPFAVLLKLSIGVIQGMEQTVPKVLIRNVLQPVIRFGLIAVVLAVGLGSLGIVWVYTITFIVAGLAGLYYIVTQTPAMEQVAGVRIRRELLTFSAPLMLMTTMAMILSNLDIFFISYFQSAGEVGTYNVVYPLSELLTMTLSGFSFIFMPTFSRLHSNNHYIEMCRIYQVVTKWIFFLTLPGFFLFFLFPDISIGVTFGWQYSEGAATLAVLSVGFFVKSVAGPNVNALTAIGETKVIMINNLIAAGVNVLLNYLLIPEYSYMGAAVATSISYTLLNVLYSFALYRQTGIHPFTEHLIKPAGGAVALIIVFFTVFSVALPRSVKATFGAFIMFIVLYSVVILRLGSIQEEEVTLLLSIEERFGVDLTPAKRLAGRIMG